MIPTLRFGVILSVIRAFLRAASFLAAGLAFFLGMVFS
jgi:hypothetical protein